MPNPGSTVAVSDTLLRSDITPAGRVKSQYHQIQHAIGVCERAGVQAKYGTDLVESTVAYSRYDADGDRAFVAIQVWPPTVGDR